MKNTFNAIIGYIKNKTASMIVFAVAVALYVSMPEGPFVELLYTAVTVLAVVTLAPIIRLLVFAEAAHYAECGKLDRDLGHMTFTPALCHYWFATAISYAAPIACIATIAK